MKLWINGQESDVVLPEDATLGTALLTVQDEKLREDEIIAQISIDGQPLTAELLSQWKDRPIQDFNETRIEAPLKSEYTIASLRTLSEALTESKTDREQISDCISRGQTNEALQKLTTYLQFWQASQQSLGCASRLLEADLKTFEYFEAGQPKTAGVTIRNLTDQLRELKSALEAGDLVLLGDILDYEFSEITETWQTMIDQLADRFDNPN
jgi:hypothetical protein